MPESLDELVVARVEHLVAAKGQGVAFVDKYISGGKERVLRAVVFGLVAGHQRVSVAKTHIADEFLYPRSEVLVIADQVGIVDADAGSCGCSPRMGKQELAGKPLRWPRCPGRRPPESPFSPGGRAGEGPSKGCARAFVLEPTTDVPEPPMNRHPPAHRPYIPPKWGRCFVPAEGDCRAGPAPRSEKVATVKASRARSPYFLKSFT